MNPAFRIILLCALPLCALLPSGRADAETNSVQPVLLTNARVFSNTPAAIKGEREPLVIEHADSADFIRLARDGEDIVVLSGRIVLHYAGLSLKADRITINLKKKTAFGSGQVHLIESGRQMAGEGFFYDIGAGRGIIYSGASVIDGILYRGAEIKTLEEDFYRITDGEFSPCGLECPHFLVEAKKVWIYPDQSFLMLHLFYKTGGVRLFYLPLAFQTKKGTGIHSYAGYDSFKGYYIQNTLSRSPAKHLTSSFRADAYQFQGLYAGVQLSCKPSFGQTEISLNQALARTNIRLPLRYEDYGWRYFHSLRQEINWPPSPSLAASTGRTKMEGYFFRASDHLFNADFLSGRNEESGIGLPGSDETKAVTPPLPQDSWYLRTVHMDGPLRLTLVQRWRLYWDQRNEDFAIGTVELPSLSASYTRRINLWKTSSNAGRPSLWAGRVLNGYDLSVSLAWNQTLFYDYQTNRYKKTEIVRKEALSLGRSFTLLPGLTYRPKAELAESVRTGRDLSIAEEANFRRLSLVYGAWSDSIGWSVQELFSVLPFRPVLSLTRTARYDLRPDPDPVYAASGRAISHTVTGSLRCDWGRDFFWSVSSEASLLTKTNERLDLSDPERYREILQNFSFTPSELLRLRGSHVYSIRFGRTVLHTLQASSLLFRILTLDLAWNQNWMAPGSSSLSAGYVLAFSPDRHTRISLSVRSANNRLYLYSRSALKQMGIPESEYRDFFQDLADSFNPFFAAKERPGDGRPWFDTARLERTAFKLQNISLFLDRDLHCWKMSAGYTLGQNRTYHSFYGSYPYWEHRIWFQISMKRYEDLQYKREERSDPPVF